MFELKSSTFLHQLCFIELVDIEYFRSILFLLKSPEPRYTLSAKQKPVITQTYTITYVIMPISQIL